MTTWTEERVERLKQLWAGDRSASWIAAELGGITRNAVIGKVHRLGLSRRGNVRSPNPSGKKRSASRPVARKPVSVPKVAPAPPEPVPEPVRDIVPAVAPPEPGRRLSVLQLNERTCRWPIGDPQKADFHFCGAAKDLVVPYCREHCKTAFQSAPKHRTKETEEQKKARLQRAQISRRKNGQTAFAGAA